MKKKYIKQLMSMGISRNNAVGYVATMQALEAAGKEPPIFLDPQPHTVANYDVKIIRSAEYWTLDAINDLTIDHYCHARLAREITNTLLKDGDIKFTAQPAASLGYPCIEYTATLTVAVEQNAGGADNG